MNILTFDIEEWFHLLDHPSTRTEQQWGNFEERIYRNTDRILSLLADHHQKATFFCLGWIAQKYPRVLQKIVKEGHEIASHSNHHHLVYLQTPEEFKTDLQLSIQHIEDATGIKVVSYRAPGFSITTQTIWAFEILAENGILYDSSVFPAGRAHGGFPSFGSTTPSIIRVNGVDIKEFPINTFPLFSHPIIFSGGGYFRLMPYFIIKKMTVRSKYIMTYFHPRDFDPHQPVLHTLPIHRRFKSYIGLKSAEKKLNNWLTEFSFTDLRTAVQDTNWEKTPIIFL